MRLSPRPNQERDLELALLRKGVHRLQKGRDQCADCGRTPLVGERVYRFGHQEMVCALCRPLHRSEPEGVDLVRHFERGQTVRRVLRPAA